MAKSVIFAGIQGTLSTPAWVRSRAFRATGIPKRIVDNNYSEGYMERRNPGTYIFSSRLNTGLFNPAEKDREIDHEFHILLRHATVNVTVMNLIISELNLSPNTSTAVIETEFRGQTRVERVRVFNAVRREVERRGLRDRRFDYQEITYRSMNSLYRLTTAGISYLRRFP